MGKFKHANIGKLLNEDRAKEINPEGLLRSCGLKEGDAVADIGCGPGFFTFPAAMVVGLSGRVYALDTQEEMLHSLRERVPPPNVDPLLCGDHDFPLEDGSVDFALVAYVLHETDDREAFLRETFRVLKKRGTLFLIDWKKKAEEKGPPVEERLSVEETSTLLSRAGFVGLEGDSLTPSHYKISAKKP